ncbi:hypothetical protein [Bradyrhizobium brasilense]|uniref:hypothetical protein n=1 Tax=Bradyrhizobium brasilense TaxID=1419277 RepID=UPI0011775D20|nr:hypothetical protein [Bradyrhizobium brasilense]
MELRICVTSPSERSVSPKAIDLNLNNSRVTKARGSAQSIAASANGEAKVCPSMTTFDQIHGASELDGMVLRKHHLAFPARKIKLLTPHDIDTPHCSMSENGPRS